MGPGATGSAPARELSRHVASRRAFGGAFTVAVMMAIVTTFGFSTGPNAVGKAIGVIGESRTLGYAVYGAAGMLTLFVRGSCATGWSPPAWSARCSPPRWAAR
jgi:hypothetical protein